MWTAAASRFTTALAVGDHTRMMDKVRKAARRLGSKLDDPFMAMSFLALPVIPQLKLTDKGLVDVDAFELTSLFV